MSNPTEELLEDADLVDLKRMRRGSQTLKDRAETDDTVYFLLQTTKALVAVTAGMHERFEDVTEVLEKQMLMIQILAEQTDAKGVIFAQAQTQSRPVS